MSDAEKKWSLKFPIDEENKHWKDVDVTYKDKQEFFYTDNRITRWEKILLNNIHNQ